MLLRSMTSTLVLLSFYLLVPSSLAAEKKDSAAPKATASQPEADKSAKGEVHPITDTAAKAGVKSCKDRINQTSNFLTTGLKSGAVFFRPLSDPDKHIVSFSLGLETPGGKVAYASESFAPNQANGCEGVYETVSYWDSGCADVAKTQFAALKNSGVIVNLITMLDGGSTVKVFLMPAGKGCVAIKKEVLN